MKKLAWLLMICMVLSGCSAMTYETLGEVAHVAGTAAQVREVMMKMPEDASVLTASGGDSMYICGDYTMTVQILPSGDLGATVAGLCGYSLSRLTLVESTCGDHSRHDWVWTAAGEEGDVVCRAAVLDDGNYHYCLCVYADAEKAGNLTGQWNDLFASFCLEQT